MERTRTTPMCGRLRVASYRYRWCAGKPLLCPSRACRAGWPMHIYQKNLTTAAVACGMGYSGLTPLPPARVALMVSPVVPLASKFARRPLATSKEDVQVHWLGLGRGVAEGANTVQHNAARACAKSNGLLPLIGGLYQIPAPPRPCSCSMAPISGG